MQANKFSVFLFLVAATMSCSFMGQRLSSFSGISPIDMGITMISRNESRGIATISWEAQSSLDTKTYTEVFTSEYSICVSEGGKEEDYYEKFVVPQTYDEYDYGNHLMKYTMTGIDFSKQTWIRIICKLDDARYVSMPLSIDPK